MKLLLAIMFTICGLQFANGSDILLTSTNHCSLQGNVTAPSMQELKFCLVDKVIRRKATNAPIYLVVNSGGGQIYQGIRFIEFAKTIRNLQTITIYAASMASAIVEALPGMRHGTENAITMFHRATGKFSGQFESGEVESRLALWKKIVKKMEKTNSDRIGISLEKYKRNVISEWSLYGSDNIKENTLDRISVIKCSHKLLKDKKTIRVKGFFKSRDKTISACPLLN